MRFPRASVLMAGCCLFAVTVLSQPFSGQKNAAGRARSSGDRNAAFEPLERWRAAVLAGDKAALAAMYTTDPPAIAQIPQGRSSDPAEEPNFWSALLPSGLTSFEPKILEMDSPRPSVQQLILRVELTMGSKPAAKDLGASVTQVWVQQGNDWRIFATRRSDLSPRVARRLPEPRTPNPHLYPDPEEAPADLSSALAASAQDHKRVLVVFGGNWCYDCHVLDATFHSKKIAPLVEANYHVVHVNIGEYDHNTDLAKRFEVPLERGVPSLAVLDSDGKLVTSQKHGECESSVKIGLDDVAGFLERWKPATRK